MSTEVQKSVAPEQKLERSEYERKSDKDDLKQQAHVHLKEQSSVKEDVVDSAPAENAGLVGGVLSVASNALHKGIDMLPASLQDKATVVVDKAIELGSNLTEKATTTVHNIAAVPGNTVAAVKSKAASATAAASSLVDPVLHPLKESYQQEGVVAAAKTGINLGTSAASKAKGKVQQQVVAPLKESYQKDGVVAAAKTGISLGSAAATTLKTQGLSALSSSESAASAAPAAEGEVKKHHGRRRRGGRRHGNRKLKTKLIDHPEGESILDSLGDRAKEIKEVVVEKTEQLSSGSKKSTAQASKPGLIANTKARAAGIVDSVSTTATGLVSGAIGTANSVIGQTQAAVSGASLALQDKLSGMTGSNKSAAAATSAAPEKKTARQLAAEKIAAGKALAAKKLSDAQAVADAALQEAKTEASSAVETGKAALASVVPASVAPKKASKKKAKKASAASAASADEKPELDRRAELPALGTPNTPAAGDVVSQKPLAVEARDDASLLDKAKFAASAVQGYVADKLTSLSENADDTEPMEGQDKEKEGILSKASKQLDDLKAKVSDKQGEPSSKQAPKKL